jgi:hypothetical protein
MPYLSGPYPSATFNFNLAPAFRACAVIQGEIFAASATVTSDLTESAARRGFRCFEFLTRLACSIDHGDAVEVFSDYAESELEEYPREIARLCVAGSRTLAHAAELCRDVSARRASETEAKRVV